ncbi:DMT family transporter [Streptomyces sp. NBC_01754]|uniref:DMT family transporter n=1 Tax=Streptomyces sp. NBC_01754 TaxID=2975930 RepID=UPI002DDBAE47|nr:DMT family transporter [Streptomyces sp. NBC_01754]WSC91676.1 DMT family transporter [Streptomyces sp. NBC_01754]
MSLLVVLLSVGAACCLGLGFVLQQAAARTAPPGDFLSPRLLLALMRVPSWLAGIGLMICGMVLGALALGQGEVSVVEPLLATNLLFAMSLSRWLTGQRLGRQGWGGLWLLAGGVAAFLLAGQPRGGEEVSEPLRRWLVIGVVAGFSLVLTAFARHPRAPWTPALLGLAGGLLYGLQDALTRVCGLRLTDEGWASLFTSWEPYGLVVMGVTSLIMVQSAFEAGPLRLSLPPLTAAQPLAGIVCGIGFLGDHVRSDAVALVWQAAGLAAIVTGIVMLGRHPAMPPGKTGAGHGSTAVGGVGLDEGHESG